MKRTLGSSIAILALLMTSTVLPIGTSPFGNAPLFGQQAKKKIVFKLFVPESEAKVEINKKAFAGTGVERQIVTSTDKDFVSVSASWEPNGYTKMVRTIKVPVKNKDEVVIDMRIQDKSNPDDITVIYVPTPDDIVEEMARMAKIGKDDIVYDLGCGDGRMVITAVKKFHAKKGVGVDINPERVVESKDNAKKSEVEDKVTFREGDVLKVKDLSDASVVMLYMGDDINLRLRPILQKTLKPGSRIVSHRFKMGDWKPVRSVSVKGKNGYDYNLHLWIIGEDKK